MSTRVTDSACERYGHQLCNLVAGNGSVAFQALKETRDFRGLPLGKFIWIPATLVLRTSFRNIAEKEKSRPRPPLPLYAARMTPTRENSMEDEPPLHSETSSPDLKDETKTRKPKGDEEAVKVFVRLRGETGGGSIAGPCCARISLGEEHTVECQGKGFPFDGVFPDWTSQHDVYSQVVAPLVSTVFEGKSAAVLCYGQTGSGKTYTMVGEQRNAARNRGFVVQGEGAGLAPRMMCDLFDRCPAGFALTASFVEIYCERVIDLLANCPLVLAQDHERHVQNLPPRVGSRQWYEEQGRSRPGTPGSQTCRSTCHDSQALHGDAPYSLELWQATETGSAHTQVRGAAQVHVASAEEALALLAHGMAARVSSATRCNAHSSRGHAIFVLTVEGEDQNQMQVRSQIYLCDLAGSEKLKKTEAEGLRKHEAAHINTSLLALRKVIGALSAGRSHVPYRDSNLTRMLQSALGGTGRAAVVCNVHPGESETEETLSTLRFGLDAATVRNRVVANVLQRSAAECEILLEEAYNTIQRLKKELAAVRTHSSPHASVANASEADASSLRCPLLGTQFRDPVMAADGYTYSSAALDTWFLEHGAVSPMTREPLPTKTMLPNLTMQLILDQLGAEESPVRTPGVRRAPATQLGDLSEEVLLLVMAPLSIMDLCSLAATSQHLQWVSARACAWRRRIERDFPYAMSAAHLNPRGVLRWLRKGAFPKREKPIYRSRIAESSLRLFTA
ncbi:hypothetical protein CYMTET_6250 [Cymbomonas tetramitiformis]|uniref:Kinesin-like protein n=1 Tax=Cymbomonas tetramitiformis TaxID=36881 RepID=A0AAE0GY06_9CHLO|nr:hypothetical protein CYMTET_6250 [Cymbomonas tetramitiformis]